MIRAFPALVRRKERYQMSRLLQTRARYQLSWGISWSKWERWKRPDVFSVERISRLGVFHLCPAISGSRGDAFDRVGGGYEAESVFREMRKAETPRYLQYRGHIAPERLPPLVGRFWISSECLRSRRRSTYIIDNQFLANAKSGNA